MDQPILKIALHLLDPNLLYCLSCRKIRKYSYEVTDNPNKKMI